MTLHRRKFLQAIGAAGSAVVAPAIWKGASAQSKFVAKLSSASPAEHPSVQGLFQLAGLVKERTKGAVEIRVFPSNQLGGDAQVLENMKLGSVEASCVASSLFVQYVPDFAIVDLPFIFRDSGHAQRASASLQKALSPKLVAAGYHPVGSFCYGSRDIISTIPITTISDIQHKKIRVIESPIIVKTWQLIGANPTPLAAPEVYLALQTKVVDCLENPASNYLQFKWYEVAKHFSKLGYIDTIMVVTFADAWMKRLPPEHVETIKATADELSPKIFAACQQSDTTALDKTVQAGCTIHEISDRDAWVKATAPIAEEFAAKSAGGNQLLDLVRSVA